MEHVGTFQALNFVSTRAECSKIGSWYVYVLEERWLIWLSAALFDINESETGLKEKRYMEQNFEFVN